MECSFKKSWKGHLPICHPKKGMRCKKKWKILFWDAIKLLQFFSNQNFNYYKSVAQHEWLVISRWREKHIVKLVSKEMKRFSDMSLKLIKSPGAKQRTDVIFRMVTGHQEKESSFNCLGIYLLIYTSRIWFKTATAWRHLYHHIRD